MATGPKNPAMAMDTNQCPGTAMDQRPAMVMASNQGRTVAANQCPATATHQGRATVTDQCPPTRECPLMRTTTNQGLATAMNPRLGTATGQRPATIIDTNQRPGADVLLERRPIRQMKMPLCWRRTCLHLLLVDADRGARALRLRWGIRLLREMNTVSYIHKLAHSPLCRIATAALGSFARALSASAEETLRVFATLATLGSISRLLAAPR
jgi:hypothetical protein